MSWKSRLGEEKPQVPGLRICVEYDLGVYYRPSVPAGAVRARYSLAAESTSMPPDAGAAAGHTPGKGRSKKRSATVFNQCS